MARTAAIEPRSMSSLQTYAATNSPHEPPVKASPVRSRTCAHLLMAERPCHESVRSIIASTYQLELQSYLTSIKSGRGFYNPIRAPVLDIPKNLLARIHWRIDAIGYGPRSSLRAQR